MPSWLIETRPFGKSQPSNTVAWVALILLKCIYPAEWFISPTILLFIKQYSHATAHYFPIVFLYVKIWVKQLIEPGVNILTQSVLLFLVPWFLLVPISLTIIKTLSAGCFILRVGRIDPGTSCPALTSRCSGYSGTSMGPISSAFVLSSASHSSLLSIGSSKSPFQQSRSLGSEMHSSALSTSLFASWWWILCVRRTFNTVVPPPGRSFADNADGKGDLSENLNAATPSCSKCDQDALTISSVSELYPSIVICTFWLCDIFCVACRCWLPCCFSEKSWNLAIVFNFLPSTSLLNYVSISVSV